MKAKITLADGSSVDGEVGFLSISGNELILTLASPQQEDNNFCLSQQQAADFLGLSLKTVHRLIHAGEFPESEQSARYLWSKKTLSAWLEKNAWRKKHFSGIAKNSILTNS